MSDTCKTNINLQTYPDQIFRLLTKDINWFQLVELYQKVGNENNYLIENSLSTAVKCENNSCPTDTINRINSLGHIKVKHILEFMGAYRKVLIDAVASETIKTIDGSKYNILQLDRKSIGNCIVSSALGSTNITSDYDITFTGPGAWKIVNCLVNTFKKYVCDSEKQELIRTVGMSAVSTEDITPNCNINTMSGTFDSNFYLMPDIIVNDTIIGRLNNINVTKFFDMKHTFPSEVSGLMLRRLIPIPDDDNIFDLELKYLKYKINDSDPDITKSEEINQRYGELVKLAKEIDDFLYKNPRAIDVEPPTSQESKKAAEAAASSEAAVAKITNKKNFFDKIMQIKRKELEAYYCVSTVLVVVFGMQAGEFEKTVSGPPEELSQLQQELLINKLSSGNFLSSAIENMIDLIKHHRHNFVGNSMSKPSDADQDSQPPISDTNKNVAKKFSKYFQRIYVSLDNYHKKKYPKDEFPFKDQLNLSRFVVSQRGKKLEEIEAEGILNNSLNKFLKEFELHKKLSYDDTWINDIKNYLKDNDKNKFSQIIEVGKAKYPLEGGGKRRRYKKKRSRKKNKRKKNKKKQTKKR